MAILYNINIRIELKKLEKIEVEPLVALLTGELDLLGDETRGTSMMIGSMVGIGLVAAAVVNDW